MPLLLFGRQRERKSLEDEDSSTTKLFFDSFSRRVSEVEQGVRTLGRELEKLKVSGDRSQISDLVLLERLQKAEAILQESLTWIKRVADSVDLTKERPVARAVEPTLEQGGGTARLEPLTIVPLQRIAIPGGEPGSLSSITTATELQVLGLLAEEGPKSAPEIGRVVGRSREHSARLMKKLFEEGYVRRDQTRIPFRYSLVERVKQTFKKQETKDGEKEPISVPQI